MPSEGLGLFLKVTLQTCAPENFPLVSMGGQAEGQACADPGASDGLTEVAEHVMSKMGGRSC